MTAFSLSLGSLVRGAPFRSMVVNNVSSFSPLVLPGPLSLVTGAASGSAERLVLSWGAALIVESRAGSGSSEKGKGWLLDSPRGNVCISLSFRNRLDIRFHQDFSPPLSSGSTGMLQGCRTFEWGRGSWWLGRPLSLFTCMHTDASSRTSSVSGSFSSITRSKAVYPFFARRVTSAPWFSRYLTISLFLGRKC